MLGEVSLDPEDYPEFMVGQGWGPLPAADGVGDIPLVPMWHRRPFPIAGLGAITDSSWTPIHLLVGIGVLAILGNVVGGALGKAVTHSKQRAKSWATVGSIGAPMSALFFTWYAASQVASAAPIVLTPGGAS